MYRWAALADAFSAETSLPCRNHWRVPFPASEHMENMPHFQWKSNWNMGGSLHVNSSHRLISLYNRKMTLKGRNKYTDIKGEILHPLTTKEQDWLIWIFYAVHTLQNCPQFWRFLFAVRVPEASSEYFQETWSVTKHVHGPYFQRLNKHDCKHCHSTSKKVLNRTRRDSNSWWRILCYPRGRLVFVQCEEKISILTWLLLKCPSTLPQPPPFCSLPIDYVCTKVQLTIYISSEKEGELEI